MIIFQDTREQSPLDFSKYDIVTEVEVNTLKAGDYACQFKDGYIPPVFFEKKSIGDLFGTLGKGYKRFKRELEKAEKFNLRLILLITSSLSTVLKGYKYSTIEPTALVKRIFSLWVRHNLLPVFCKDKTEAARFIVEYYSAIGRKLLKDRKTVGKSGLLSA